MTLLMDIYGLKDRQQLVDDLKKKMKSADIDVERFEEKPFAEMVTGLGTEALVEMCCEALTMINPILGNVVERPLEAIIQKIRKAH